MLVVSNAAVFDHRHFVLVATITCCLVLVASDWSSGADGEPMFQRFAIMATGDVQATGLGDLLMAKLWFITELWGWPGLERGTSETPGLPSLRSVQPRPPGSP